MSFSDSVEHLADRFGVVLEKTEQKEKSGPSKTELKDALEKAAQFYHFALLHSDEGAEALRYLYGRGLDLEFIRLFQIGYAPRQRDVFQPLMRSCGYADVVLEQAGLMLATESGRKRDFFYDRIMFPIRDGVGNVIGFSGRKFREETTGGKYINTSETPLFKKSQVLFGLSYSRRRIAKDRKAIIVEGQIDALRLIQAGLNFTVAGQGTAFGDGQVKELCNLGVTQVFLAMDSDLAGQEAAVKVGDLFQKRGVSVSIVPLPEGSDPDSLLREEGPDGFIKRLSQTVDYLPFLVAQISKQVDASTPAGKNELVKRLTERIRAWELPVLVHESLQKVAELVGIPAEILGLDAVQSTQIRRQEKVTPNRINPDKILESDLLRLLLLSQEKQAYFLKLATTNLVPDHFQDPVCRKLFETISTSPQDFFTLGSVLSEPEAQLLSEILERKVNFQKAEEQLISSIHKILQREWMSKRESIKAKIHSGTLSEDEVLELAKEFDAIKKQPPEVSFDK
jgi:DNA primase